MSLTIGVVGLGSIGRRHARCLKDLGVDRVLALRSGRGATRELPTDLSFVIEERDADRFWSSSLDGVIVATPTALHGEALARIASRPGLPALVEKPLVAHRNELSEAVIAAADRIRVAYCLRFHPLVRAVHDLLAREGAPLGRIVRAQLSFGQHLPKFHPDADYRTEYSARRDLGGGVLRTISHELDLVLHWMGRLVSVTGDVARLSDLEIDVDDSVALVLRTQRGAQVMVDLDYLSPSYRRHGWIQGTGGRLDYSFTDGVVRFTPYDGAAVELHRAPEVPFDFYRAQMIDFLDFVSGRASTAATLSDSLHLLTVMELAERAQLAEVVE
ncbi:Gfo/Idh/MocA family protein [Sandaracinus amylolyticus]|uniref:Gfo/Idh/MocA family protein n=1 Tax=Sandaracinus amylolyticus TaxID=927083 RepID=UPI001F2E76B3|nr:Gfo/Idh/MocA family oxidoreductase [Sandaracinus amylolyticus]UJR80416.1 Gfo/Idh/MocA family oxidoreductase [Sandaracinus amylolyticus]